MKDVKSITAVNTTSGWAVCQSNSDGTQLFVIPEAYEPRLTQATAETAATLLQQHMEAGGRTYAKPLPAGVRVVGD